MAFTHNQYFCNVYELSTDNIILMWVILTYRTLDTSTNHQRRWPVIKNARDHIMNDGVREVKLVKMDILMLKILKRYDRTLKVNLVIQAFQD